MTNRQRTTLLLQLGAFVILALARPSVAQHHGQQQQQQQPHQQRGHEHRGHTHPGHRASGLEARSHSLAEVGQDAFVALAEARTQLLADPATDWQMVDLDALREHLVDMHRVLLFAEVEKQELESGFRATVTGEGRTLDAIRRMVPAHAAMQDGHGGLSARVEELDGSPGGVVITVTTTDREAIPRIQGLGFFGFLTAGEHHLPHHWSLVRGQPMRH